MKTDAMLNNNPKQLKVNQQNLLVHLNWAFFGVVQPII